MGSGGMIVMDESSCMVDVAKYFMDFCMTESCGKCVPCRVGTYQMNELLARITGGDGDYAGHHDARRTLRPAAEHQPVRPRPVRSQSGAEHVALLRRRIQSARRAENLSCGRLRTRREGSVMNPGTNIKTLKIDGKDFSARQDETILAVARQNKIFIPTLCDLRGLSTVGACRLCLVEVKGANKLLPCLRDPGRGGHGSHHHFGAPGSLPTLDPGTSFHRAQPHLLGVRLKRTLRIADPGAAPADHARPLSLPLSQGAGGWLASTASSSTTTAASCARAACACARKSKARIPGT